MRAHTSAVVRTLPLLAAALALVAVPGSIARASCVAPDPELLWSYPEHDADDVPTNIQIWIVTTLGGGGGEATLNGEPLQAEATDTFSATRFAPAELAANTRHVLELTLPSASTDQPAITRRVEFTTGDGPAAGAPDAPTLVDTKSSAGWPDDHACAEVLQAQDCFDTGQDTLLTFELDAEPATVGWLITATPAGVSMVWPGGCGHPAVFGTGQGCFELRGIGSSGALGEAADACARDEAVTASRTGGSGCSAGGTLASRTQTPASMAFAVALLARQRSRARRRSRGLDDVGPQ